YQNTSQQAHDEFKAKSETLANAKALYERDTKGTTDDFRSRSNDLKKASLRYQGVVDPVKNRADIESIKSGNYIIYAPAAAGKAVFEQIIIEDGKNKLKIETLKKDPFEP
ncbi:MAG TPA: hypothetical protein VMU10_01710, partial [Desulfomonilia bacterium]|nr:hypothetical protein [Desulfomonilia bacterium]